MTKRSWRSTDEQAKTTQDVVGMVDDVATISEETTSEAENVAAVAEEQTASISEVTENVRTLSTRSDELQDLLGAFTIEKETERKVSAE